jgi:hypothetical protein
MISFENSKSKVKERKGEGEKDKKLLSHKDAKDAKKNHNIEKRRKDIGHRYTPII